ncbi:MAG: shikimate dehydrogenase family protein, partial [Candidatus Nitrosotenuis sp.]
SLGVESEPVLFEEAELSAQKCKFLVNATSIGLKGETSPISAKAISPEHIVYDIVYIPMNTDFISQAKKSGATIIYGYEMLLGQASIAFEIWHKIKAPYDAMKKVLLGGF